MKSRIRVLIVDDHALFREMLLNTLAEEEDIEVVGEAVNGSESIRKVRELRPDVVVMDINMPVMDGIEATESIVRLSPETKVVVLTAHDDEQFVFHLVRAGAAGFLLKDVSSQELIRAIRTAHSGEALIQPRIVNKILKEFTRLMGRKEHVTVRGRNEGLALLTERELEVLKLVAGGKNNKEIAAALFIGEPTVKTHVANLMNKLGLRDRVEAVLFAIQSGVVNIN